MTEHRLFDRYFISVVAVLTDDRDIAGAFVRETAAVLAQHYENYELVLVDNHSTDGTEQVVADLLEREECVRYIRLSNRYDIEVAMCAGLETVIGDIVISIEPQCDPADLIPRFVERTIESGGVVYGIRARYDATLPMYYRVGKRVFHALSKMVFAVSPPRDAGFFMGLSRAALNALLQIKGKTKFLRVFGARLGFGASSLAYDVRLRRDRMRGRTAAESVDYGLAVIFTNSPRPLRVVSWFGLLAALANLVYAGVVVALGVAQGGGAGALFSTSLRTSAMFFLLFLMVSFFIEYVTRSGENTREGPLYHVDVERTSNVMIRNEQAKTNVCDSAQ